MREWSWLLRKLANIHRHPWALLPHQRCGGGATSTGLTGDDCAGNLLGNVGRKVVEDIVHPSSDPAVVRVARQQSGKTLCTGGECGRGRLGSTFRLGLELGVSLDDADVTLAEVFLALKTLEDPSFAEKIVVDTTLKLVPGQFQPAALADTLRQRLNVWTKVSHNNLPDLVRHWSRLDCADTPRSQTSNAN